MEVKNEITDSIREAWKKRLASPLYGVYILSWAVFHWELLYTAAIVDQDKIWLATGLLKNEYLRITFFNLGDPFFYLLWVLPAIVTYLIIWHAPQWLTLPAFRAEEQYKVEKIKIHIRSDRELEKEKLAELQETEKRVEKERDVKKVEKEIEVIDPGAKWEKEYEEFRKHPVSFKFALIIQSIYEHHGLTQRPGYGFSVPKDMLALSHTNGLVDFDSSKEKIELTDKGKFFVKKFSEEKG